MLARCPCLWQCVSISPRWWSQSPRRDAHGRAIRRDAAAARPRGQWRHCSLPGGTHYHSLFAAPYSDGVYSFCVARVRHIYCVPWVYLLSRCVFLRWSRGVYIVASIISYYGSLTDEKQNLFSFFDSKYLRFNLFSSLSCPENNSSEVFVCSLEVITMLSMF